MKKPEVNLVGPSPTAQAIVRQETILDLEIQLLREAQQNKHAIEQKAAIDLGAAQAVIDRHRDNIAFMEDHPACIPVFTRMLERAKMVEDATKTQTFTQRTPPPPPEGRARAATA